MSTPSLVSDYPSGASPSNKRIAKSPSLFSAWKARAKIVIIQSNPPVEVKDHFDKLYQLEEVPSTLVQGPLPTPFVDYEAEFQRTVRTWASTLRPVEGDEYGILPALPTLAFAYSHVRKTSNNRSEEHIHRSIDDIIDLAFSAGLDRHCQFRTEESYRLVVSAGNPDAESDTLVTIPSGAIGDKIQEKRISMQGDPTIFQHLYWSTHGADADDFSIIGFPGEFKKDEDDCNKNQLIMVLATAQAQRKALGLKPSIIMGAVACRGQVQIFSSFWKSDESSVRIYEHEQQFNLSDPIQVLRLYVFCSKLERHLQGLALELETWNTPTEMALQSRTWRSPDHTRKRRRTESMDSGNGSNGEGGGNNGPVEAGEFDGDWYTNINITKWRDEVVMDGKGRVVSDEDNILDAASGWLQFEGRAIAPLS